MFDLIVELDLLIAIKIQSLDDGGKMVYCHCDVRRITVDHVRHDVTVARRLPPGDGRTLSRTDDLYVLGQDVRRNVLVQSEVLAEALDSNWDMDFPVRHSAIDVHGPDGHLGQARDSKGHLELFKNSKRAA